MNKPRQTGSYPDRRIDCQFAMEGRFLELIDDAEDAGWSAEEAVAALIDLADNHVLGLKANEDTDRQIREALERLRGG